MSKILLTDEESVEIWRLRAFDGPTDEEIARRKAAEMAEEVILPTAEEVEAMQEMARQEGYHAGYREGFSEGEAQVKALKQLVENVQTELAKLDEVVAAELLSLALGIARQTLGFAYQFDTQLVGRMVEHALQTLPASLEPTRILLHPDDLEKVENHLSSEFAGRKLSFIPDPNVTRGGSKLMTATTDIDGTFESRWERVTSSLDGFEWKALPPQQEVPAPTQTDETEASEEQ